jgi:hypothetical protein
MKWFKHDADMHQNRKIRKLIRTHGATGYAFWCVLLEKIYSAEGNFQIPADDLWFEDIAEDLKLGDYRTPIRILDTLSELGLISTQLWQDHVIAIPSVVERGDQYLVKRASEAEKKRGQRAKKAQLSLGDKAGTKGQKAEMSPSDTDPYSDSDSESYLETEEKNKNLDLNIDPPEADFSPPLVEPLVDEPKRASKPKVAKPKVYEAAFQVFQDSYNQNRPSSWAKCQSLNKERVNALKALWKQYGENTLEVFEQALSYLREDKWHSSRDFGIDYLLGKGRVTTYSERCVSASIGNPEAKKAAIFLKLQSSFNDEARAA